MSSVHHQINADLHASCVVEARVSRRDNGIEIEGCVTDKELGATIRFGLTQDLDDVWTTPPHQTFVGAQALDFNWLMSRAYRIAMAIRHFINQSGQDINYITDPMQTRHFDKGTGEREEMDFGLLCAIAGRPVSMNPAALKELVSVIADTQYFGDTSSGTRVFLLVAPETRQILFGLLKDAEGLPVDFKPASVPDFIAEQMAKYQTASLTH